MTKKSLRRREMDFSNILPNHALPEDIPPLFRKTAEEIAGAFFEDNKRSPIFRARWRNDKIYVRLNWASFIGSARAILLDMLTQPGVSEPMKQEIYEAFLQQGESARMVAPSSELIH